MMELALNEIKIQAKRRLKAFKTNTAEDVDVKSAIKKFGIDSPEQLKLKHCQLLVVQHLGFSDWQHAQAILSGSEVIDHVSDMGALFHNKACNALLNEWFTDYQQAKKALTGYDATRWLMPYKKQFVLVKQDYLTLLNINDNHIHLCTKIENDFYGGYNTQTWDTLACLVIKNRASRY